MCCAAFALQRLPELELQRSARSESHICLSAVAEPSSALPRGRSGLCVPAVRLQVLLVRRVRLRRHGRDGDARGEAHARAPEGSNAVKWASG